MILGLYHINLIYTILFILINIRLYTPELSIFSGCMYSLQVHTDTHAGDIIQQGVSGHWRINPNTD